ncbi:hypothetical protein L5D93_15570 [Paenibacillus thiaminolyticus]|nr:hypothetical protein [Paenibacillus thiaminolyticus]
MLELMRLEWEKSTVSSYFRGFVICIAAIFVAVALMAWAMKFKLSIMFGLRCIFSASGLFVGRMQEERLVATRVA